MSEKGGTLFLVAMIVIIAGIFLTVLRPMFTAALDDIRSFTEDYYQIVADVIEEALSVGG